MTELDGHSTPTARLLAVWMAASPLLGGLALEAAASSPRWIDDKEPAHTGLRFESTGDAPVQVEERNGELILRDPYSTLIEAQDA